MGQLFKYFLIFISLTLLFVTLIGCSPTKHLKEDEVLLRNTRIHLRTDLKMADKSSLKDELNSLLLQKSNTYLFGLVPYKVWLYNMRYQKYQRDTSNFQITSKVVEKPEIYDSTLIGTTEVRMKSFLTNDGFFYAKVNHRIAINRQKAKVHYYVRTGQSYLIDTVQVAIQDSGMASLEKEIHDNTLFISGTAYSNSLAGRERARISNLIRNAGYFKFSSDNIYFELDTLNRTHLPARGNIFDRTLKALSLKKENPLPALKVKAIIKASEDSLAFKKFYFDKIVVFPDYKDSTDLRNKELITKTVNGIEFRYHKEYVHTSILDQKIFMRPDKEYSENDYNKTIRELNDLGIFQYVRVFIFKNSTDTLNQSLYCYILMNPSKKYDFNTNLEVSGGDLYTIGSAVNLSVTDKNFLKGANQLTTTLAYGIEMSQNKYLAVPYFKQFYFSSQNLGLNFQLSFPKFLLPVRQSRFNQNNIPRTILEAGANSLNRINYFSLRSYNTSFGYTWRESKTKSWIVKPVFVNVLNLRDIDSNFQKRMDTIPAIKNSYQETFIEGESIELIINTEGLKKWQYAYLKLGLEEAGGILNGIRAFGDLINNPISIGHAQYVRLDFDARQYFVQPRSSFIFRFYGGVGVPYGQSSVLPYIKQYYSGGAYSLRGWRPRVLGPGSYYDPVAQEGTSDNLFLDQSGDIKLEFNGEYRFNMLKLFSGAIFINGALFVDAGNIWLMKKDSQLPGANFDFNYLYQDIAMSSGAGIRADFGGFLVIRLDWAIPLKQPYIFNNHGWVIKDIDFLSQDWRSKNINLNIAIGYPF